MSAGLFQYNSRAGVEGDKWLNFWRFLDEARTPAHRALAETIRNHIIQHEIAARNWSPWNHLKDDQKSSIRFANYTDQATRAVKESIASAARRYGYRSVSGYYRRADDKDFADLLESAAKQGTTCLEMLETFTHEFREVINTPRSNKTDPNLFAIRFLDDPYHKTLPDGTWTVIFQVWTFELELSKAADFALIQDQEMCGHYDVFCTTSGFYLT